ncbi:metal-dependent hydrolase [Candidatus Woesearchaeota archaeon]|nr:metal-dependent hydrolase [Candidatus Woesearchaeota archaeon]
MPNYKTHLLVSLILSLSLFFVFYYYKKLTLSQLIFLPYILFLGIIPDIDTKKSLARKMMNIGFLSSILILFGMFYILLEIKYLIIITIFSIIILFIYKLPHRGMTHNLLFGLLMTFFLFFISPYLFIISYISFLSHLAFDKII